MCEACSIFFVPSPPHPLPYNFYQCGGCLSSGGRGDSWPGCQVWPAISAVSILEVAAIKGSSGGCLGHITPTYSELVVYCCKSGMSQEMANFSYYV